MAGTAKVTILGCGGSGGVPLATNHWGKCDPHNPKNMRMRTSIAVQTDKTSVVIDTGPEFRMQTIRFGIESVDAVLYTHAHSDHVCGMPDLRYVAVKKRVLTGEKYPVPIYLDDTTLAELKIRYEHLFVHSADGLYEPEVKPYLINRNCDPVVINDELIFHPFYQTHGYGHSMGYRIGDLGYSTDVSKLDASAFDALKGIKTWVVDCGQFGSDFVEVHPNLNLVMQWNEIVRADKIYLTHLTPLADYDTIQKETDDYIEPAYDGLKINIALNQA